MKIHVFAGRLVAGWVTWDPRQPEGDRCRFFPTWDEAIEYADRIARIT